MESGQVLHSHKASVLGPGMCLSLTEEAGPKRWTETEDGTCFPIPRSPGFSKSASAWRGSGICRSALLHLLTGDAGALGAQRSRDHAGNQAPHSCTLPPRVANKSHHPLLGPGFSHLLLSFPLVCTGDGTQGLAHASKFSPTKPHLHLQF